jgi:hypothetical protein
MGQSSKKESKESYMEGKDAAEQAAIKAKAAENKKALQVEKQELNSV